MQISNIELAKRANAGHPPSAIAASLGVTTSAITQALATSQVSHARALLAPQESKLDDRYDALEDKALAIMERRLPMEGGTMRLRELTQVMSTLNGIKRRSGMAGMGQVAPVVNLTMPIQILNKVVLSPQSEIVEIDGRAMATLEPSQITQLVEVKHATRPSLTDLL